MEIIQELSTAQLLRHRRYLVFSVVAWVVMLGLGGLVLLPQGQFVLDIQNTIASENKKLEDQQAKLQFLEGFELGAFRTQNTKVTSVLPSVKPFLSLLHALRSLATEQNIVISGLDWNVGLVSTESAEELAQTGGVAAPQTSTAARKRIEAQKRVVASGNDLEQLPFEVTVLGQSTDINRFLVEMNRLAPIAEVTGIQLRPQPKLGESLYEATLDVISYYAPLASLANAKTDTLRSIPRLTPEERAYVDVLLEYRDFSESATFSAELILSGKLDPFAVQ